MCEKGSSDQHMQMSEVIKGKERWRCLHFNCIRLMGPRAEQIAHAQSPKNAGQ